MQAKYIVCLFCICTQMINSTIPKATPFYLYDRFNNRAISYQFTDAGNIYYTSDNFHSVEYADKHKNKTLQLRRNETKSLP